MEEVTLPPTAATAGTNIDMPSGAAPIGTAIRAIIMRGHAVDEGGSATYDIKPETATVTKVDEDTITLDTDITTYDEVKIQYHPAGLVPEADKA